MVENKDGTPEPIEPIEPEDSEETDDSQEAGAGSGPKAKSKRSAKSKKSVEEKLDDLADRFSKAMTDGVKRMEDAFDRGMQNIKEDPDFGSRTARVKNFFKSSMGGAVLIVIGFVWFFYAVGLLDNPIFPIIVIVIGFYLMQRYKSS